MKKNKWMRLASLLLIICLITTCTVTGTYAKYTTQDSGYDVARVAKWGVELQVVGDLYGQQYLAAGTGGNIAQSTYDESTMTVHSIQGTAMNSVTPGTENLTGINFSINGKPEVENILTAKIASANVFLVPGSYGVMVPMDNVTEENWAALLADGLYELGTDGVTYSEVSGAFAAGTYYTLEDAVVLGGSYNYYPVAYQLEGTTTNGTPPIALAATDDEHIGATTGDTLADAGNAIAKAMKAGTDVAPTVTNDVVSVWDLTGNKGQVYQENVDLATAVKLDNETLKWAWAFERDDDGKQGDSACLTCKCDTILGNMMAEKFDGFVGSSTGAGSAEKQGKVVYLDGSDYKAVKYVEATYVIGDIDDSTNADTLTYWYVTDQGDATIASLSTFFCLDIDVTQVD